jgi:pimeloyl-ACP methyl ester carboxylesterase
VNLANITLAYREWHPGGVPVLLLHGLADYSGVWLSLAAALGDRFHCIAPDLRGHGDSSKPLHGYSCDDVIADLAALVTHLGWEKLHVVAHSWGAKVAAVWARQQPERIQSLVLVDPFFIDRLPGWMAYTFPLLYRMLPFLRLLGPFSDYAQAEAVARQLKQYQGWSEFQAWVFQGSMAQQRNGQWGSKFVVQARDEVFADMLQVAGLTEPIAIPTLFVQPEQGLNRTAWQLRPYRRFIRNLTLESVPGNHWCFLVEPQAFNQTIQNFLTDQIAS